MALGPSTIVLGILTCIPFGLAIRDTVKGTSTTGLDYGDLDFGREDRLERAERIQRIEAMAEEEARLRESMNEQAAERKAKLDTAIGQIFSTNVSSLGEQFTTRPGDRADPLPEHVMIGEPSFERTHKLDINHEAQDGVLHAITIEPEMDGDDTRELCDRMDEWFVENWGDATATENRRAVWYDDTTNLRTVMLRIGTNCKVVVERAAKVEQWIDKSPQSIVPVWAIGQSPRKLTEPMKLSAPTGETFEWSAIGLGAGTGKTQLVAHIARGKVVAIEARVSSYIRPSELEDHLTELFGDASEDDPSVWKTKPPIAIDTTTTQITVVAGKLPEE